MTAAVIHHPSSVEALRERISELELANKVLRQDLDDAIGAKVRAELTGSIAMSKLKTARDENEMLTRRAGILGEGILSRCLALAEHNPILDKALRQPERVVVELTPADSRKFHRNVMTLEDVRCEGAWSSFVRWAILATVTGDVEFEGGEA